MQLKDSGKVGKCAIAVRGKLFMDVKLIVKDFLYWSPDILLNLELLFSAQ